MTKALALPLALLLTALHTSAQTPAPAPANPHDRLTAAAELTSFDGPTIRPWHWIISVTLFDSEGQNPQPATIEAWFANGSLRTLETLGSKQVTTLGVQDKAYRTGDEFPELPTLDLLLRQFIRVIPIELLQPQVKVTQRTQKVGKDSLECLLPALPLPHGDGTAAQTLSYCFKPGTNSLLITYFPGTFELRQRVGTFQGHEATVELLSLAGETRRFEAKTTKLEGYVPKASDFVPTADMYPIDEAIEVDAAQLMDQVLSKVPPTYPALAKVRHAFGVVKFRAIIGTDGHVESLNPIDQPDPDLLNSAKQVVPQWIYRPYTVCGVPIKVKTIITVNYNLGR